MKKYYAKQWFKLFFITILLTCTIFAGETEIKKFPPNYDAIVPQLNFKNTDIRDIMRGLALEYKTNIVIDNSINKKISVALFDVKLIDAIKIIATDNGFAFKNDDKRFFIKDLPKEKPKPKTNPAVINYNKKNDKIDIKVSRTNIKDFIETLRKETSKNYLLVNGTSGFISGELNDIKHDKGLKNILLNNGFYFKKKDSIYFISRAEYFATGKKKQSGRNGNYWVQAESNLLTIDVKDVQLSRILDDITNQLNLQIIKLANPDSKITIKCNSIPLDKALYYLFKGTKFTFKKEDDTYIIGEGTNKNLDNIKLVRLHHLRADKVHEKLPKTLVTGITTEIVVEHNAIALIGNNEKINQLEQYLQEIDHPVPQVMIEALVIDYNLNNLFEMGVQASTGDTAMVGRVDKWFPGFDVTAGGNTINNALKDIGTMNLFGSSINVGNLGKLPDNFFMNFKLLEEDGIANVKSRPVLSTLNGHTASLRIGTIQNYVFTDIMPIRNQYTSSDVIQQEKFQKIEAFISFEITPWVGPNNQLTLHLKPDFQTPVGKFSPDKKQIPAINTRTLESTIRLKDGETIVLGGLIQDTENNKVSKVPILGDIPILGSLFRSTSTEDVKAELIIYITPHIFYENEFGARDFNMVEKNDDELSHFLFKKENVTEFNFAVPKIKDTTSVSDSTKIKLTDDQKDNK
ncbi:MAG: hypothetical protein ACEPO8_15270 [Rhodothermaceae bacterium]